ncbi:MAG: hypothetical protein KR126chlam1_01485 [Chlamydiae bacterium]|nr:hypothetical protein [Chlamydiota bacterium]
MDIINMKEKESLLSYEIRMKNLMGKRQKRYSGSRTSSTKE